MTTDRRELVLTLFEQGEHEELPFFVELLDYLDEHRLPVPGIFTTAKGLRYTVWQVSLLYCFHAYQASILAPLTLPNAKRWAIRWGTCMLFPSVSLAIGQTRATFTGCERCITRC